MQPKLETLLRREWRLKLAVVLMILAASLVVLLTVDNMLASFVLAFVVNYLLSPIVDFLERKSVPRQVAILIPFAATGLLIGFALYAVFPMLASQVKSLQAQWPKYQVELTTLIASSEARFKEFFNVHDVSLSTSINSWIFQKTADFSSTLPSAVSGSLTVLLLTPIFAYFMLADGKTMSRRLLSIVPNSLFEPALNLHYQLNEQMGGFIRARFLEAAVVGLVVWVGLQISGFPYASLLALVAGVTNLIPYVGPIIGAVPAVLIALLSPDALINDSPGWTLVIVSSIYVFAQLVDVVFIIPMVVAKIVNLHPVTVIVVIIIGSKLMGILGMVISIPVTSALKLIFHSVYDNVMDYRS